MVIGFAAICALSLAYGRKIGRASMLFLGGAVECHPRQCGLTIMPTSNVRRKDRSVQLARLSKRP